MINYSVVKRYSVVGDTTSEQKYYPNILVSETMEFEEFCQHLSEHGCAFQKGDIMAIITLACECLRELMLEGYKIKLSSLGSFQAKVQCTAADSYDEFTSDNITGIKVAWTVGSGFDDMLEDAKFKKVINPSIASAALAALKDGETSVDWSSTSEDTDDTDTEESETTDDEEESDEV